MPGASGEDQNMTNSCLLLGFVSTWASVPLTQTLLWGKGNHSRNWTSKCLFVCFVWRKIGRSLIDNVTIWRLYVYMDCDYRMSRPGHRVRVYLRVFKGDPRVVAQRCKAFPSVHSVFFGITVCWHQRNPPLHLAFSLRFASPLPPARPPRLHEAHQLVSSLHKHRGRPALDFFFLSIKFDCNTSGIQTIIICSLSSLVPLKCSSGSDNPSNEELRYNEREFAMNVSEENFEQLTTKVNVVSFQECRAICVAQYGLNMKQVRSKKRNSLRFQYIYIRYILHLLTCNTGHFKHNHMRVIVRWWSWRCHWHTLNSTPDTKGNQTKRAHTVTISRPGQFIYLKVKCFFKYFSAQGCPKNMP